MTNNRESGDASGILVFIMLALAIPSIILPPLGILVVLIGLGALQEKFLKAVVPREKTPEQIEREKNALLEMWAKQDKPSGPNELPDAEMRALYGIPSREEQALRMASQPKSQAQLNREENPVAIFIGVLVGIAIILWSILSK